MATIGSSSVTVVEWLMSGTTVTCSAAYNVGTNFQVSSLKGDINGDGKTDIVFNDSTAGNTVLWLMNGTTITSSGVFNVPAAFVPTDLFTPQDSLSPNARL